MGLIPYLKFSPSDQTDIVPYCDMERVRLGFMDWDGKSSGVLKERRVSVYIRKADYDKFNLFDNYMSDRFDYYDRGDYDTIENWDAFATDCRLILSYREITLELFMCHKVHKELLSKNFEVWTDSSKTDGGLNKAYTSKFIERDGVYIGDSVVDHLNDFYEPSGTTVSLGGLEEYRVSEELDLTMCDRLGSLGNLRHCTELAPPPHITRIHPDRGTLYVEELNLAKTPLVESIRISPMLRRSNTVFIGATVILDEDFIDSLLTGGPNGGTTVYVKSSGFGAEPLEASAFSAMLKKLLSADAPELLGLINHQHEYVRAFVAYRLRGG